MNKKQVTGTSVIDMLCYSMIFLLFISIFCSSCGRNSEKNMVNKAPLDMVPAPPKPPSMIGGDTIWNFSDKMPVLPGNEEALFNYIGRNLHYPDSAKAKGIQGKVVVRFSVTDKGNVTGHEVIQSVTPELDAEAMRVIKTLTRFEPGYIDGKTVSVYYEVPISFVLK
jgi:TonB family protein